LMWHRLPSHPIPCRSSDARCGAVGVAAREHLRPSVELRQHGAAHTATWGYGSGMRQRRAPKQRAQWCRAARAVAARATAWRRQRLGAERRRGTHHPWGHRAAAAARTRCGTVRKAAIFCLICGRVAAVLLAPEKFISRGRLCPHPTSRDRISRASALTASEKSIFSSKK